MIFLRVLPKIFLWSHYSGALGARGPRFIEPPEPPVPMPLGRRNGTFNLLVTRREMLRQSLVAETMNVKVQVKMMEDPSRRRNNVNTRARSLEPRTRVSRPGSYCP